MITANELVDQLEKAGVPVEDIINREVGHLLSWVEDNYPSVVVYWGCLPASLIRARIRQGRGGFSFQKKGVKNEVR